LTVLSHWQEIDQADDCEEDEYPNSRTMQSQKEESKVGPSRSSVLEIGCKRVPIALGAPAQLFIRVPYIS
jgi:hypothetical protein